MIEVLKLARVYFESTNPAKRGIDMQCGSCGEVIPSDSIFCPECGARQEMSRAGNLPGVGNVGLGGQQVQGGRNFGVVSGEAVMNQNMQQGMPNQGMPPGMMPDIMGQVNQNLQGMPPTQIPDPAYQNQPMPTGGLPPVNVTPLQQNMPTNIGGSRGDMPPPAKGPSLASGIGPVARDAGATQAGGMAVSNNPSLSPTDAMVNRIAEAERAVKNERRSQWLQMNQESAANVLSSIGGELPSHLRSGDDSSAAEFLANAIGSGKDDSGNEALFKRMSEVAVRRVARKRGVAVETPQVKVEDGILTVNVTYIDDGRVLDTPEDLTGAFEHAISTEVALKGLDASVEIKLFKSKDGSVEQIGGENADVAETSDEEMFACEVCDGLVKESDSVCPHCGAIFEDEEEVVAAPARGGPPGRARGGPPGPSRGGPPGPSRGGPPGPSRGGPPKKSGPPGPSKGGPPSRGPGGGPPKKSGPPGPSRGGPPSKGPGGGPPSKGPGGGPPKKSGPPGPSRGGPPSKGPGGGPPKKSGPPSGGPGGPPPKGPGRGPPKKSGPPSGPKRGPPK